MRISVASCLASLLVASTASAQAPAKSTDLREASGGLLEFRGGNILYSEKTIQREGAQGSAAPGKSTAVAIKDRAYFWGAGKWPTSLIYVCWENPESVSDSDQTFVRTAVSETWERHSTLRFQGWTKCAPESLAVRVRVKDDGPLTLKLGKDLAGVPDGMILNFTLRNWEPDCTLPRTQCLYAIVVHEFGHAIGFAHEQNRPDTPGECAKRKQGDNGDDQLTSWDPKSVMNYCNRNLNGGKLSDLDKLALQKIYGKPRH